MWRSLTILLALAVAVATARGQYPSCYPYYGSPVTTYGTPAPTPSYHVQPQTYVPPGYEPAQPYYPAQKVVAQEISVAPLIVTVPVDSKAVPAYAYGNPYYYSVSEAYREKAYLRDLLREELKNAGLSSSAVASATTTGTAGNTTLRQLQQALGTPPAVTQPPAVTAPPAVTPPARAEQQTAWVPDGVTPADLQKKVLAAYQGKGNCLNCHGAEGPAQGPRRKEFRLVVSDGKGGLLLARQPSDKRWKIYGMASVGAMPPAAANDATKAMEATHLPALLQYAAQQGE